MAILSSRYSDEYAMRELISQQNSYAAQIASQAGLGQMLGQYNGKGKPITPFQDELLLLLLNTAP